MDQGTNEVIKQFVFEVAKQTQGFVKAYLFGSYAKNTENDDSDIDIALIFKDLSLQEKFDFQVRMMQLASAYDVRIEPHPFSVQDFTNDNPFVFEIKKIGIELTIN